ncbi:M23 family metallopeptidase [Micromonospora sp. HM5-17]|jgi:murein DD-endopeptidase MepM/ murein hydrolase activator NlpD|uniref:M23 family metallopeptidase n=1 Tax=Micromonospora sp. HM5-17 TaxID=2487710 RepID=UPI000F48A5BE|nr:M23 family metallopeptidase [Micromonospora sp. HM5-17]ROT27968.1 M23 family metallopeptidase [Micromonospora sp. HM5-17]
MFWGGNPRHRVRRGSSPVAALLVAALVAGCADARRQPEGPRFEGPDPAVATTAAGSPASPPAPTPDGSADPSGSPSRTPDTHRYAFPVRTGNVGYHPTHSGYPATDLFAACGSPVVAVTSGRILEVSRVDTYRKSGPQGPNNGGKSVSLLGDDGVRYYGSHLNTVASGIDPGVRVRVGQQLGTVGKTGNANNVCHLHFGISPPCHRTGDWWIRRGVVWPATFLDAWRKGRHTSPAATVRAWHRKHGCPREP